MADPAPQHPFVGPLTEMGRFLRLWFLLAFSYALVKFVFNLGLRGFVDISPRVLDELLYIPPVQAAVFWAIARARRQRAGLRTED